MESLPDGGFGLFDLTHFVSACKELGSPKIKALFWYSDLSSQL
jgi:hypothetical protein